MSARIEGFDHAMVDVGDGVRLHCVSGGAGPPLVLLHGFPQTWYEWRDVMPALAKRHRVIAVDLKGAGLSDKPVGGYDKVTMAGELERLRVRLGLGPAAVVGHDIGGMVGFAWAATYRDAISRLAVLDIPLPGVSIWEKLFADPRVWHFAFFTKRDLPEWLIGGREHIFIEHFIRDRAHNQGAFSRDDIAAFADAFAQPGAARGAFEWYRAFAKDVADNRPVAYDKLTIPVLALGGDQRWGGAMVGLMREFVSNVVGGPIADCGHWIVEEQPSALLDALDGFLQAL